MRQFKVVYTNNGFEIIEAKDILEVFKMLILRYKTFFKMPVSVSEYQS